MTPIGIKLSLDGQREVSQGLQQVGRDVGQLGNAGAQLGGLSQGMGKAALTAGQLQQATQQLPMQFQDIVVSLQAGQQPLTVLLQQGSQLAGSFGGAGAAAKAMLGYVVGLINPITVLAAGVATVGVAYYQGSKEQDAWVRGIVTTGNASGVTTSQLREYARAIDGVVGTQRQAAAGLADFVQAGVRGGDELRRYTEAAVMWESATGQAVSTTAKQFADLQGEPLEAVLKLNQGTNFLTVSVYEQIKALESQGRNVEASRVAMDALESTMRDRAKQIEENLGYIERGWKAIKSAASEGWDAMLNIGRPDTLNDQLASARSKLQHLENDDVGVYERSTHKARLARQREIVDSLEAQSAAEALNAAAQAESVRLMQARVAFDDKYSKALESEVTLQQKLTKARAEAEAAGKSEADIKKVLAFVTEEHNKSLNKGASAAKQAQTSYESLLSTINQKIVAMQGEATTSEKLTETEKLRAKLQEELATKGRQYSAQQRADLEAGLKVLDAWEQKAIAARELAKAQEEDARALARVTQQRENSLKSLQQALRAAQDEEEAARLAAASNISNGQAIAMVAAARAEDAYMQAVASGEAGQTLYFLEQERQARQKLVEVMGQRGVREANEKAAKDAAKEWERMSKTVGDTLADYIMAGGKDAATYLKRLFSTLVLQPVVQAGVGAVFGVGGGAAAAGAASNPLGMLQSGQSLWSSFSGGLSGTLATGVTQLGSLMGSSFLGELGAGIAAGGQLGIGGTASLIGSAGGTTGVGMTIGAAAPWIAGAGALYSLVKSFDNSGTPHMGAGAIYSGGNVSDGRGIYNRGTFGMGAAREWSSSNQSAISGIAGTLGGALDGFAKAFGKEAGYTVATAFADDSSGDGAWGSLRIADALGNVLVDWERSRSSKWAPRIFADGEAGYQQYLSAVAGDVKKAFLAMDLPGWADEVLSAAKDIDTLSAAIQQIGTIKTVFDGLGQSMAMFKDLSGAAQTKLLQVSGSVDTLASNAQSFYANYYSEQERLDATVAGLTATFAKYGAALPATTEQYRALVEQQMAAGEAGAEFAAVLLGLNGTFKQVADAWKTELDSMEGSVGEFFDGLKSSISDLAADVAADRKGILRGTGVLTADQLRAAIAQTSVVAVSTSSIDAASRETATAASYADVRDAQLRTAQAAADARQQAIWAKLQAAPRTDRPGLTNDALWEEIITQQWNAHWARFGKGWNTRTTSDAERAANMDAMVSMYDQRMRERLQTQANAQAAADASGIADAQKAADEARLALQAAQQEEAQARVDYAAKINQFVADANGSITKLSELRGEVVSFYEAQAQAVQTMLQSAGNIRGVVDQLRMGQLSTAQTAAELGSRYASDYSMALATSGSVRAGYVDSMASNLSGLTEALKAEAATGEDWRIQTAKLFAQANKAAGLLESDAKASNYQDVALGLLDSIDSALASLGDVAKSAEQVIADAVNNGTQAQLAGLRAIVAALKGETIPAFAVGGLHTGGLRIVGENGPELEATGPSRIWSAQQLTGMLGGGGGQSIAWLQAVVEELRQMREEGRAHALATLDRLDESNSRTLRWDVQGMPEVRPTQVVQP